MAEVNEKKPARTSPENQPRNASPPVATDEISPAQPVQTADGRRSLNVDEKHISDLEGQDGVRDIEAITQTWSKKVMIITYAWLLIINFVLAFESSMSNSLIAYVTSDFQRHSLLTTAQVVASIFGGVSRIPIAKIIDIWGRPEGFALMTCFATLGTILMAVSRNVETYAAALVFYTVGENGMNFVLDVLVADTSKLRNRALLLALMSAPFLATAFAGPAAAENFLTGVGWRWAYGTLAIIIPISSVPILWILLYTRKEARKQFPAAVRDSGRTWSQNVAHYAIEFDVVGMILVVAGFSLVILPLTLATYQADKWRSAAIITMIVLGGCSLIAFCIWEKNFAKVTLVSFHLLWDRTVMGACIMSGVMFVASRCWSSYFQSHLQVVFGLSIKDAGWIGNIYTLGSCSWSFVVGYLIRVTNRYKWLALMAAPLLVMSAGLMIKYRMPGNPIGLVAMCQVLETIGAGTLVVTEKIAIMAAAEHTNVAMVLALLALFTAVGDTIGLGVSGAIWTNSMPQLLQKYLPQSLRDQAGKIFGSLVVQLSYLWGTPGRIAIVDAYGEGMQRMCIAACAVLTLTIPCAMAWRNLNIRDKQMKGRVM
ncbi:putative siderochrome-iron transporter [Hypoxylon trugodes]|uniref:putative siderochrome-iron transporter n=1 Tax=Hypoxylon trugodes TaxID=326681 RepID=UPI00219E62A0|nr:putative siderochrome-iron transporter [Hypoxylon trugodes]KAI1394401.1 putative siderochrome-iron transporter [Hypoxylon trugodes]